jgi:GTPase SAR1 family protein
MTTASDEYGYFQSLKGQIVALLRESEEPLQAIEMHTWVDSIKKLEDRVGTDRFRVMVLGEFKRGKSTFINALLGQEVLPAFATPCTAIINEIKWGEARRAALHFKNPLPAALPPGLPRETLKHLANLGGKAAPPLDVPVGELERFVAIPDPAKDQAASIAETPYDRIELFWPLEILRNSVELIDSPGLNEHGSRTRITMEYLARIDAVVFVFSVHALVSQSELSVIDNDVRGAGHEYVFFVCNRFDELRKQNDRDRVTQYAYDQLAARTAFGRDGIFFVSSLDAVIGREEQRPDLTERSGIPRLESQLANFLVHERGRVKLLQPARQLAQGLHVALFETIPNQRRMLETSLADLQKRCDEAKPRLVQAEKMRDSLIHRLNRVRSRVRDAVKNSASEHLRTIAEQVPFWAGRLSLESSVNALKVWAVEAQVEKVASEVVRGVSPMIEQATAKWRDGSLHSLIEDELAEFNDMAQESVAEFMESLDHIRSDIAGITNNPAFAESEAGSAGRVLVGIGGSSLSPTGTTIPGVSMNYQSLLQSLVPQIAVAIGAIAVLHLNPITLVPALIAMGAYQAFRQGDALTQKVKTETGRAMAQNLIAAIPEHSKRIAETVYDQTEFLVSSIGENLDREISTVREQVDAVLAAKKAGEAEVARKQARLNGAEQKLKLIDERLDEFITVVLKR